jgi:hypothetical protein
VPTTVASLDARIAKLDATIRRASEQHAAAIRKRRLMFEGWSACPDCTYICRNPKGIPSHRGKEHVPMVLAEAARAQFDDSYVQVEGRVFRCACGTELLTIRKLTRHTYSRHGNRLPSKTERTPVEPSVAA